jgi:hypothetical protein
MNRMSYGRRRPEQTFEMRNLEGVNEINRPVDKSLEEPTRPLPAWMEDPSLLPKKPPGRR